MKVKEIIFLLISAGCCVLSGCKQKSDVDISGFWYSISNDTTYEETVLTAADLWLYKLASGEEVYRNYEIDGDSISFLAPMNKIVLNFVLANPNEFYLKNSFFESHYYRVDIALEPKKVIRGAAPMRQQYVDGFRARKIAWKKSKMLI
jgi:hypothetical protein